MPIAMPTREEEERSLSAEYKVERQWLKMTTSVSLYGEGFSKEGEGEGRGAEMPQPSRPRRELFPRLAYALSLMDALFSDEEMGCKCFTCTSRSHKTPLSMDTLELIEGMFNVYSKNP